MGGAGQKITAAELLRQKEQEAKELEKKAGKKERVVAEYEYENLVNEPNLNKIETVVDARNIDEALQQLDVGGTSGTPDKHPEKRLKAAYKVRRVPCCCQDPHRWNLEERPIVWSEHVARSVVGKPKRLYLRSAYQADDDGAKGSFICIPTPSKISQKRVGYNMVRLSLRSGCQIAVPAYWSFKVVFLNMASAFVAAATNKFWPF